MSSEVAIRAEGLCKRYDLYAQPSDRLKQILWRGRRRYYREFWALRDVSIDLRPGEVLGVIGRNGAGKSTLLQLICGTLTPTSGSLRVDGRVAALLELGAGFNPEFSGRENIYLNASILGLSQEAIDERCEQIIDFSGIRDFIDQPVKTYSSGMYVRLAFSIATSVEPDILVVDEALAVGDGEFARKSFDRIMALRDGGKTILFCSHSMYQIEALCNRALWLEEGSVAEAGAPSGVVVRYNQFLDRRSESARRETAPDTSVSAPLGTARIARIRVSADGATGPRLQVASGSSTVSISMDFVADPALPAPSVAVLFTDHDGRVVASAGTLNDGYDVPRDAQGRGTARIVFERFPLLKGTYWVYGFLMCEKAIHFYENAEMVAQLEVTQNGLELGFVSLPHRWEFGGAARR